MASDDLSPSVRVADLRKRFEGKGRAQTPAEFTEKAKSRANAASHNVALRLQQLAERKKLHSKIVLEDWRVSQMTETEINQFLESMLGDTNEGLKSLRGILETDILVNDSEIDSMTIPNLIAFLKSKGAPISKSLSEMRLAALRLKQQDTQNSTDQRNAGSNEKSSELTLLAPQLTTALSSSNEDDINRAILCMFFEEYEVSRLSEVDSLLAKYKGNEDELFAELAWQYPEHANKIVLMTINATYGEPPTHPLLQEEEQDHQVYAKKATTGARRTSYVVVASN